MILTWVVTVMAVVVVITGIAGVLMVPGVVTVMVQARMLASTQRVLLMSIWLIAT